MSQLVDLNILGMMMGEKPKYAPSADVYGQRLAVIMAVSDEDIGRSYGGNLSIMAGQSNDSSIMAAEVTASMDDSLAWMQENTEDLPDDFTAQIDETEASDDSLVVRMSCGPEGDLVQTEMTIGQIDA